MLVGPGDRRGDRSSRRRALGRSRRRAAGDEAARRARDALSLLLSLAVHRRARSRRPTSCRTRSWRCWRASRSPARARHPASGGRARGALARRGVRRLGAASARMLDGIVLGAAAAGAFAWTRPGRAPSPGARSARRRSSRSCSVEQHAATGAWLMPTQTLYFARSDWPPTCHRLGFGPDIGCTVEHPGTVARLGRPTASARARRSRVARERAGVARRGALRLRARSRSSRSSRSSCARRRPTPWPSPSCSRSRSRTASSTTATRSSSARGTSSPQAPFFWLLVARGALLAPHRARGWLDAPHARGAGVVVVLAVASVVGARAVEERASRARPTSSPRAPTFAARWPPTPSTAGILKTRDYTSFARAFDPWADGDARFFALEDGSGLLELRRAHPDLPRLSLAGERRRRAPVRGAPRAGRAGRARAAVAHVRPAGRRLARSRRRRRAPAGARSCSCRTPRRAAQRDHPVRRLGRRAPTPCASTGPQAPTGATTTCRSTASRWRPGTGTRRRPARRTPTPSVRTLASGRHVLVARCTGRDPASHGYDARLDALIGQPAEANAP